jgi:hypothetical protein
MITVHTDRGQIQDFNNIAKQYNFELLEIEKIENTEHEHQEEELEEVIAFDGGMLNTILRKTFDIVSPNWQITDEEVGSLVEVYLPVLDKYNIAKYLQSVEFNAVLITGMIFYSRRGVNMKDKPNQPDQQEQVIGEQE